MKTPIRQRQLRGLVLHHAGDIRRASQTAREPHGQMGRAAAERCLSMVL